MKLTDEIRFEHISMEFPGVLANDDISLSIRDGEVFALIGENGAGKSTLMNILYGINTPTAGSLYVRGEKVTEFSPKAAIDRGIGMVHQHFMLVPSFTVAQNIVLGHEPKNAGVLFDNRKAEQLTRELVKEYGLEVDPSAEVRDISVGLQQRVEILKTLYRGADILILDEPTAVLTPQETDELFDVIRRIVREKKMTVIIIMHKLYEVMAISDRVGVMRQGKLIGVENTCDVDEKKLASMMVGRPCCSITSKRPARPAMWRSRSTTYTSRTTADCPPYAACRCPSERARFWALRRSRATGRASFWKRSPDCGRATAAR